MEQIVFQKLFTVAEIPSDWTLVRLTLDWDGHPLLLFVEGKSPQPDFHTNPDAWSRWYRTPPKMHHLVYEEEGELHFVHFERSQGLSTFHVQPFEGGWKRQADASFAGRSCRLKLDREKYRLGHFRLMKA